MINKQTYIQKFKALYEKKNGKNISDFEALELFEKLVVLVNAVYKPIKKSFFEEGCCPHCREKITFDDFKDPRNEEEFLISGLCQNCQNKVFK